MVTTRPQWLKLQYLFFIGLFTLASTALIANGLSPSFSIDEKLQRIDITHPLTLTTPAALELPEAIATLPDQGEFVDARFLVRAKGSTWLNFRIENKQSLTRTIILHHAFAPTTRFDVFSIDSLGQHVIGSFGDAVADKAPQISHRTPAVEISLRPGLTNFYIRVAKDNPQCLLFSIYSEKSFYAMHAQDLAILCALIAIVFVMLAYNVVIYLSLRINYYLFYIGWGLVFNICFITLTGLPQALFFNQAEIVNMSAYISATAICSSIYFFCYFAISFLSIETILPRYHRGLVLLGHSCFFLLPFIPIEALTTQTSYSVKLVNLLSAATGGWVYYVSLRAALLRSKPAYYFLIAFTVVVTGSAYTAIIVDGLVPMTDIFSYAALFGGSCEILLLSISLGKRVKADDDASKLKIQDLAKSLKVLNLDLDKKVVERTAEINALLEHIPQGVLSIGTGGLVEANFSAHLPSILEKTDIAKQNFKELFLDHLDLSNDDIDQIWQAILVSINENSLNFELNQDKFPIEVNYTFAQSKKTLKLTWNIESDSNQSVTRILVTMLDITQEIHSRQELEEKNMDLAMIKQLIEVGTKKASQFFGTAVQLLDENIEILSHADLSNDALKIIFVNTHTVKGAARTLQLKELAEVLHNAEAQYVAILKHGAAIQQSELILGNNKAKETFLRYLNINRVVLGRDDDFHKIHIDRHFLEQHYHLLTILNDTSNLQEGLQKIIHKNRNELTRLIFLSLDSVLQETLGQAEKIAKDLQKEPPLIQFSSQNIMISHRQEITIKNCFIHILRNALDHGIETGVQRKQSGKNPRGTIYVNAREDADCIHLELWDDGKGLSIEKLRERVLATEILGPQASLEEIANSIFIHGVSTSESVSQFSGRGVGMNAVKRFIEAEHGTIHLALGTPTKEDTRFYHFKFVISLPRGDVQPLESMADINLIAV